MSLMNIVMNDMISDVEPVLAVLKYELIIILSLNCIRLDTYVDVSFDCALVIVNIYSFT